jgi:hypothetical protein
MEELATGGIYSQTRERELLSQTGSRSGTNPLESEKWPNPITGALRGTRSEDSG